MIPKDTRQQENEKASYFYNLALELKARQEQEAHQKQGITV